MEPSVDELAELFRDTAPSEGDAERPSVAGDPLGVIPPPVEIGVVAERFGGLPFRLLTDAVADEPDEPEWLWDGYLARSTLTLFAGRPKVGKSTQVFALLAALVRGEPFLGRETRQTGTLILSEERGPSLAEKVRRFNLEGAAHVLLRHDVSEQSWPEVIAYAADYCEQHELGLLVIDTMDKWTGLLGDAENSAGGIIEALTPLIQAAGRGLCILIVTHQRKSTGQHGEAVRGSSALAGGVDIIIELERMKDLPGLTGARVLKGTSRFAGTPDELAFVLTDDGYEAHGDPAHAKAEALRGQLLELLTDEPDRRETAKDLAAELDDIPETTVRRALNQLADENQLIREGEGKRSDPYTYGVSATSGIPSGGRNESLFENGLTT